MKFIHIKCIRQLGMLHAREQIYLLFIYTHKQRVQERDRAICVFSIMT